MRSALLVMLAAPLAIVDPASGQVDGSVDLDFGEGGVVIRSELFEQSRLAALAANDELLVAVGRSRSELPSPPDPPSHAWWSAVGPAGEETLHACAGESQATFPLSFAHASALETALIDSAGRLVVGGALATIGTESQDRALLARFALTQPGCVIDGSFSGLGWEVFDDVAPCDAADCVVVDLVEQTPATGAVATRRYVALVRAITGGLGASRFFLLGLSESGAPDPTFSGDGWAEVTHAQFGVALQGETRLAVDPRGRLHVAATYSDPEDALDLDVAVLRLLAHGAIDTSFGDAGFAPVMTGVGADPFDWRAFDVAVQADGTVLVAIGHESSHRVWARTAGGNAVNLNVGGGVEFTRLAVQGNGRAIAVADVDAIVADTTRAYRLDARAGSPSFLLSDPSWGSGGNGIASYDVDLPTGDAPDRVTAALLWHGRLVLGGDLGTGATFLLRAENAYLFADGFEGGTIAAW